jgi:hypothetical protein
MNNLYWPKLHQAVNEAKANEDGLKRLFFETE